MSESNENPIEGNENGVPETPQPDLQSELEKAKQELLYAKADFENTRKRLIRDQDQAIRFANQNLVSEFLGFLDTFELALGSADALKQKNDKEVLNYLSGIEMTHKQLLHTLEKMGVERIGKIGDKFDPEKHEAVSQQSVESEDKVGTIVHVITRGSLLHGRLLKPARVVVGEFSSEKTS